MYIISTFICTKYIIIQVISIRREASIDKACATGLIPIHKNYIKGCLIRQRSLCGVQFPLLELSAPEGGDLEWPACSPDLAPCDFYLWGFLKSKVYVNRPRSLADLNTNIRVEVTNIPANTLSILDILWRLDLNEKGLGDSEDEGKRLFCYEFLVLSVLSADSDLRK
ncbi:unnamed protein product [Lepeophtheirus salmonis]|uniref:(salmon louse) hypothetical protein n=1 Tax=Lepeophtheirus salmonis TaxID=72036 RepID=A0A7R8CS75_LEPSM|nr:unnamed protein product [Lepeophtheirus salmonis]CAF2914106.1 unnamed protein product [Lepeophtheirus salmonis]